MNINCQQAYGNLPVSASWSFIFALTLSAGVCSQKKDCSHNLVQYKMTKHNALKSSSQLLQFYILKNHELYNWTKP